MILKGDGILRNSFHKLDFSFADNNTPICFIFRSRVTPDNLINYLSKLETGTHYLSPLGLHNSMDNIYFSRLTQKDITKKYGHPIDVEFNPQGEFQVVEGMAEKLRAYLKENPY